LHFEIESHRICLNCEPFVSGILLGRQSQSPDAKIFSLSETSEDPTPTITSEPSQLPSPTERLEQITITPSKKPEPTTHNSPASPAGGQPITNTNLSDFKYPNSSVTSENTATIVLTSTDSPQTITTWYENKMKELGYSSRASAKTNTNGNVTNKLGGGKNDSSVNIEITKKANEGSTKISVTSGTDSGSDVHIKIENNEPYL
jgi:hypothetical protein